MAESKRSHTEELESKVLERTQALEQQARTDALTGLLNRHGMHQALGNESQRALRQGTRFGLIWLDIDNFKTLNDDLGHGAGDQALMRVAQLLKSSIRPYDMAARWGGDEFLVLLSPCDEQALRGTGERIRLAIEQESGPEMSGLTVSVGGSLAAPGEEIDAVLQRADDALYKAKAAGRNLFRIAG
jgi:diguanylate cyclase (GGDEF)-like protein